MLSECTTPLRTESSSKRREMSEKLRSGDRDEPELRARRVEPLGVAATNDVDALLALKPDCVVYNPMLIDVG